MFENQDLEHPRCSDAFPMAFTGGFPSHCLTFSTSQAAHGVANAQGIAGRRLDDWSGDSGDYGLELVKLWWFIVIYSDL